MVMIWVVKLSANRQPVFNHPILAQALGFRICTTPIRSPQSNGMAEAFVKTFKRDYVYLNDVPDAETVLKSLCIWIEDYNCNHPHSGLKMKSPREFRSLKLAS